MNLIFQHWFTFVAAGLFTCLQELHRKPGSRVSGRGPADCVEWSIAGRAALQKLSQKSWERERDLVQREMRAIIEADYQQAMLLPACVEDWIGTEHPARYIRELIRSLDLEGLGFSSPDEQMGGKVYSQRLLLGLWLYGYWKRIRSSRKLESACGEEMAFIWLSGNTRPDHNTLWRFWSQNQAGIKRLFQRSVELAMEMGEVELVLSAIDGTKLQAVAWYDNTEDNPHNPDANVKVRWGGQTYEEMMVGFFDVAVPANMDKEQFFVRK